MISKGEARTKIRKIFVEMTPSEKSEKSSSVSEHLKSLLDSIPDQYSTIPENFLIGTFAPFADEVEWMFDPQDYINRLCFPKMGEDGMSFARSSYEALELKTAFGVRMKVPAADCPEVTPHLMIVPGMAFTRKGDRLGRGKGYYDKYLESFEGLKFGICFEEQILEEIPTESHDIRMDLIITDKQVYGELAP